MMTETFLDLIEIGITPQSARGIGQTLTLETSSNGIRRLFSGELRKRVRPSRRKYRSTISFSDLYPPAFDNLSQGDIITVWCAAELSGKVGDAFSRTHVPGSVIWRNAAGFQIESGEDETIAPVGATTYTYRPIIIFMVDTWDIDTDEYGAVNTSSLSMIEV